MLTSQTDVTRAILSRREVLSHECATLLRDKVADAATVKLHKQTRLLHHFSRFPTLLHKQFQNDEIVPYLIFSELFD